MNLTSLNKCEMRDLKTAMTSSLIIDINILALKYSFFSKCLHGSLMVLYKIRKNVSTVTHIPENMQMETNTRDF